MTIGIYMIHRVGSDECYVGQSIDIEQRWKLHRSELRRNCHHSKFMQRVYNRHGFDILEFSVLIAFDAVDSDALTQCEQLVIDLLHPKYNGAPSAGSPFGIKRSEATKRRISESKKGTPAWNKGMRMSDSAREKMSRSAKTRVRGPCPEHTKRKIGIANNGFYKRIKTAIRVYAS